MGDIALTPDGKSISRADEQSYFLYDLDYSTIRKFDVGSKPNSKFPQQKKIATYKPLLSELIDSVEAYATLKKLPLPFYNIEIKSTILGDNIQHPRTQEFVDLIMHELIKKNIIQRVTIQSFDIRPLQLLHQQHPEVKLSYLTANFKSVRSNLKLLGFTPQVYSPYYKTLRKKAIKICHHDKILVIPWTVDTKSKINKLKKMGVDGIITDYPELF